MRNLKFYGITIHYNLLSVGSAIKDHVSNLEKTQGYLLVYTVNDNDEVYYFMNSTIEIKNKFVKTKVAIELKEV